MGTQVQLHEVKEKGTDELVMRVGVELVWWQENYVKSKVLLRCELVGMPGMLGVRKLQSVNSVRIFFSKIANESTEY